LTGGNRVAEEPFGAASSTEFFAVVCTPVATPDADFPTFFAAAFLGSSAAKAVGIAKANAVAARKARRFLRCLSLVTPILQTLFLSPHPVFPHTDSRRRIVSGILKPGTQSDNPVEQTPEKKKPDVAVGPDSDRPKTILIVATALTPESYK
jgi:hypothetical protein